MSGKKSIHLRDIEISFFCWLSLEIITFTSYMHLSTKYEWHYHNTKANWCVVLLPEEIDQHKNTRNCKTTLWWLVTNLSAFICLSITPIFMLINAGTPIFICLNATCWSGGDNGMYYFKNTTFILIDIFTLTTRCKCWKVTLIIMLLCWDAGYTGRCKCNKVMLIL